VSFFVRTGEGTMKKLPIGNIKNFKKHSQFKSLKDFNNNFEQWMVEYKHIFTKLELLILKRLVRFSAKILGVCNAKINTILGAVEEYDFTYGASRSTFKRMISKSKKIGLLKVEQMFRKNESKSSNLYIFQRFQTIEPCRTTSEQVEVPTEQQIIVSENNTIEPSNKTNNLFKAIKIINKRIDTLDYTFTLEYVPKQFNDLVKCFYDDSKTVEEYWSMAKIIAYKSNRDQDEEIVLSTSIEAFKQMINKLKKGKINNSFAYFYGILKQKYEAMYFEELHEIELSLINGQATRHDSTRTSNNPLFYNWLET
jgi:hypothetical protein